MEVKKTPIIFLIVVCIIFFVEKYIVISFDRDSVYKVDLPKDMKVANYSNVSDYLYKNIYIDKQSLPSVGDYDVLVYVSVASFSQIDFNFYKNGKNSEVKSFVPCTDFAGKVVKVGKKVKKFEVGDRVFGIADISKRNGACAEYVSVPQNELDIIPYSLTDKQAASIPTPALLNYIAYRSIEKKGLKNGKILIDDSMSETGIMLTGLLTRNGFNVSAIDKKDVMNWAYGFGVKEFIDVADIEKTYKKYVGKFDAVVNLRKGVDEKILLSFVKKGGEFISLEDVNVKSDNVKIKVIKPELIDNSAILKMARLVHLGKLEIKVAREYNFDQIKDAYMRAEKGNLDGKVIINIHPTH